MYSQKSQAPWLTRWIGFRSSPPSRSPNYVVWIWSFIGPFACLAVLQLLFLYSQYFVDRRVPSIFPSYAASVVLIFGAIEAPLAQPRSLVGGHFVGALVGVCITKLFLLLPAEKFQELSWLVVSLSCAASIVLMQITGTLHPPGGATAILPAADSHVRDLGWYFLPVILLCSIISLVIALVVDNIQRAYPVYWFIPPVKMVTPGTPIFRKTRDGDQDTIIEEGKNKSDSVLEA
ncbi:hypothetical protein VKT23_006811 [Stygiomarasmius scandens]|uniref:HPP transmembrane region domain-containing protein n=1 Tax=Marasmiellus scandens TaxID=2682957 RepID=A0ABR1JLQ9_9AGAR